MEAQIMDMKITLADKNDAEEILALQKLAYLSEAAIYDDYLIPPLHQTLSETEAEFDTHTVLKAVRDERIIGSVRAHVRERTGYIGKLIVHPDHQNQGIGTRLMRAIEGRHNKVERFELFTGQRSEKNLYLYQKLGYKSFKKQRITPKVALVYMEKPNV